MKNSIVKQVYQEKIEELLKFEKQTNKHQQKKNTLFF